MLTRALRVILSQLSAQPEDQEINNLTKHGYDGCTQHFDTVWDSSQG
jgi:hypothetical protein